MSDGKPELTEADLEEFDDLYFDEDGNLHAEPERIHKGGWKHPDEK